MATHSSVLAWRMPWTGEPGGLPSVGLQWGTTEQLTQTYTDHKVEKMFTSSIKEKYLWCCRDS